MSPCFIFTSDRKEEKHLYLYDMTQNFDALHSNRAEHSHEDLTDDSLTVGYFCLTFGSTSSGKKLILTDMLRWKLPGEGRTFLTDASQHP